MVSHAKARRWGSAGLVLQTMYGQCIKVEKVGAMAAEKAQISQSLLTNISTHDGHHTDGRSAALRLPFRQKGNVRRIYCYMLHS